MAAGLAAVVGLLRFGHAKRTIPAVFAPYANYGLRRIGTDLFGDPVFTGTLLGLFHELFPLARNGSEVFVSPDGSDGDPGTRVSPLRTFRKALESIGSSGTIWMRPGIYPEGIPLNAMGTPPDRRTLLVRCWSRNYGERVVLVNPGPAATDLTWDHSGRMVESTPANEVHLILEQAGGDQHVWQYCTTREAASDTERGWTQDTESRRLSLRYDDDTDFANVTLLYRASEPTVIEDVDLYFEGVTLRGLHTVARGRNGNQPVVMMERCSVDYADERGIHNLGAVLLLKDSAVRHSAWDGIGAADEADGADPRDLSPGSFTFLIDSLIAGSGHVGSRAWETLYAGYPDVRNSQAFSAHDGGFHAGIGTSYTDSLGQNIADVQTTTGATWLMRCDWRNPRVILGDAKGAGRVPTGFDKPFPAADFGGPTYLDTCKGGGTFASHGVRNIGTHPVKSFNGRYDGVSAPTFGEITPLDVSDPDKYGEADTAVA